MKKRRNDECVYLHPVLNENIWSWVGVGVSVFLRFFWCVPCSIYKGSSPLRPTTEIQSLNGIMNRFMQFNCGVTKP